MKHGRFEPVNLLDQSLFRGLFEGLRMFRPRFGGSYSLDVDGVRRILVVRPGGLGDLLLALPLFRRLKETFPAASIDLLCMKRNAGLARIVDEELGFGRLLLLERDVSLLLRGKYDLAISLDQSKYQFIIPALMGMLSARIKIGYDIGRRGRFCTHPVVYRHDEHEAQCSVNGLRFFGLEPRVVAEDLLLKKLPEFGAAALPVLERNHLESGQYVACSFGGLNPQNKLPEQTIRALLALLCREAGLPLVVLGGPADFAETDRLCTGVEGKVLNLCGQTSLRETIGLLSRAAVFFGYDGGPLHMAVAAGCKTVSVWGPSLFEKWAPRFSSRHVFVKRELACQPCLTGRFPVFAGCPFDFECLKSITAEEIAEKIQGQLASK